MEARSTIISCRRHVRLIAAKAAVAVDLAASAFVEVFAGEASVEFSSRGAHVGSLSRVMVSPLEDAAGGTFSDGSGGVIHVIG